MLGGVFDFANCDEAAIRERRRRKAMQEEEERRKQNEAARAAVVCAFVLSPFLSRFAALFRERCVLLETSISSLLLCEPVV